MKHTDTGEHALSKPDRSHGGHPQRHDKCCGHEGLKHGDRIDDANEGAVMKMKDKKIVPGNGLAELAARHKSATRSRVQTHAAAPSSRISLKRRNPRSKTN